jgi:hypothetical protein
MVYQDRNKRTGDEDRERQYGQTPGRSRQTYPGNDSMKLDNPAMMRQEALAGTWFRRPIFILPALPVFMKMTTMLKRVKKVEELNRKIEAGVYEEDNNA